MNAQALKPDSRQAVGPGASAGSTVLELYLAEMRQLFNSMDPAPFRERDLDPKAADYIVDWASDAPKDQPLSLIVHLGQSSAVSNDDASMLQAAVHDYFARQAVATRKGLSQLLRTGRISLVIGVVFVGAATGIAESLSSVIPGERYARLVEDSLVIGAWVALWRPMEIFLYDWWPIRADAKLFDRLAAMPVTLRGADEPVEHPA